MFINRIDEGSGVKFTATKGLSPVPVAIAALSISLVPQILIVMMSGKCSPIMIGLIAAVAMSSIALAGVALEELVATEIYIDHDVLKWHTLISSRAVEIGKITKVELGAVDGALGLPQLTQGPPPIGVWVSMASQKPKQPDERVLVLAGPPTVLSDLEWIKDSIETFKLPAPTKQELSSARLSKIKNKNKPKREFRRPVGRRTPAEAQVA